MPVQAKYAHTNIVARDWRSLARFYTEVFGCAIVPPERDNRGEWVEQLTALPGARVQGAHLRLPGYGADGPTLEIFQFNCVEERPPTAINRPGFAHIAFQVDNVHAARECVLQAGGLDVGKVVSAAIPGAGAITVVYMSDPEGNIIELQRWSTGKATGGANQ